MSTKLTLIACLAAAALTPLALPATAQNQQQPDFGQMLGALLGGAAQGQGTEAVEPINFRDLKDLLPKELDGMKRVEASGERNAAMGMNVSTAKAVYKGEDNGRITIEFSDIGALGSFAALAHAGWASAEIDKETEFGYERTTKFDGVPGKEQYDSKAKSGEISAFIEKRLMAKVEGYQVSDEDLHEAFKAVDLEKLGKLATQAAEDADASEDKDAEEKDDK